MDQITNPAIPDTPHMDQDGLSAFAQHIKGVDLYLEYGCGGSTVFAANSGVKKIIAVDTSKEWAQAVKDRVSSTPTSITAIHCDVGTVGEWGRPVNNERIHNYYRYMAMPWEVARNQGQVPQLIMIDGRFRVACFLYSLLCARTGTTILFDDYAERKNYHLVEKFCDLLEMRGRMAVFTATKQFTYPEIAEAIAKHSIDSD